MMYRRYPDFTDHRRRGGGGENPNFADSYMLEVPRLHKENQAATTPQ